MIIGVQLREDKPRREIEVQPGGRWGWIVKLTPDSRPDEINDATLAWLLDRWGNQPPDNPKECLMLYEGWDCPHYPAPPCQLQRRGHGNKKLLAVISVSPYAPELVPVGQMTLDKPQVTHRRHWRHIHTGELLDQAKRPWVDFQPVCRTRVIDALDAHINGTVYAGDKPADPRTKWRIRPYTNYKKDQSWLERLATRHTGHMKPCVFEQGVI